ncbi:MFS transporter [Limnoglobus roseus]|uniref:MFS transporter n=1 Tax=Limnoglobus roseus TaxID=2598579 RepID=A0A5C1APM2_9BACT|nr:MFS transporter [Limnoglobus roseus]QEL18808.1 MFS transporter [Limnoglobus roseus]
MPDSVPPTKIRYRILAVTAVVAVFMYVDRVCLASASSEIRRELALTEQQMDWVKSAFFWSYALFQVPAAALALRFGFRNALAGYLFLWSFFTVLNGLAGGLAVLLLTRLAVGLSEAGAYPSAATLMKNWFPLSNRGTANSIVALGGRAGGALGQRITPLLMVALAGVAGLSGWRNALILFGFIGMSWAVIFWTIVRDSARVHPAANAAEADLIGTPAAVEKEPFPWRQILVSGNLWLASLTQFGINIGWTFVITHLPDYLEAEHKLTGDEKGFWGAMPLTIGLLGMLVGGVATDRLTRRLGLRWGRALPIGLSLFVCSAAYASCIYTGRMSHVPVIVALCFMTVFVDLGIPSVWAFAQDVGGRHVGAALGWANMWGNFGAALSPIVLGLARDTWGWPGVFATCAGTFLIASVSGLMLNAGRPLVILSGEIISRRGTPEG